MVNKVVIPDRILIPFVTVIHEAYGHVGSYKTFKIINESFFASKMLKDSPTSSIKAGNNLKFLYVFP